MYVFFSFRFLSSRGGAVKRKLTVLRNLLGNCGSQRTIKRLCLHVGVFDVGIVYVTGQEKAN
jgi:hypothetical protein